MLYVFVVVYSLSCVQLFCDPMGYSPPGSSFHGISQARNWSELSSPPGDLTDSQGFATCASSTGRQILYEGSLMCIFQFSSVQFSHVWLFATPQTAARQASLSFTISQSQLKLLSIELVMPSNHLILSSPSPPTFQSFPASGSFPMSQLFVSRGQSIGALASVLPMNIQDWFPLGWTGWISLQSKGLSRVFSNTIVQKHQFFSTQLSYSPTLTSIHDYWKNHSLD